jgi:hypothetical protein
MTKVHVMLALSAAFSLFVIFLGFFDLHHRTLIYSEASIIPLPSSSPPLQNFHKKTGG